MATFLPILLMKKAIGFFDTYTVAPKLEKKGLRLSTKWVAPVPFFLLNLSVLTVFWVGWSPIAVGVAIALYAIRMFGITGVYHRYLSHKTYKTSRLFQFLLAFLGNTSAQRGPLWWAAHHRHHHRFSDQEEDIHSPRLSGFWNSHMLWWGRNRSVPTRLELVKDLQKFPELVFLDRFDGIAPATLALLTFLLGFFLNKSFPQLQTSGMQMLVWGFVISTSVLFHGVAFINSLAHVIGKRRFKTSDDSRNSFWLALITLGEGWHNNHHHYANSVRQGFYWWEIDISYYALWMMSKVGLVWDLKPVPQRILDEAKSTLGANEKLPRNPQQRPRELKPQWMEMDRRGRRYSRSIRKREWVAEPLA